MIQATKNEIINQRMYSPGYNLVVLVCQRISYALFRVASPLYVRKRFINLKPADIVTGTKYVVVANHQTHLDPFVANSLIPYAVFRRLNTLRFFAHTIFFSNIFNRTVMASLGAFPTKEHTLLPHGLAYAKDQLDAGRTVMIFPEGRMSIPHDTPAKPGVGIMAQWPHVMIIPIHLGWSRNGRFGRNLSVNVGKPFSGKNMSSQEILDRVFDLPV